MQTAKQFVKKVGPVVTAMRLDNTTYPSAVAAWCGGKVENADGGTGQPMHISYKDGKAKAYFGEWIVCENCAFHVESDESFRERYAETFAEGELPSSLQIGDAARVSFLREGTVAMVTKVHFSPSKVMYDFELSYPDPHNEGTFIRTRIHNIDSALVSLPPEA